MKGFVQITITLLILSKLTSCQNLSYELYPVLYDQKPKIQSPGIFNGNTEIIVAQTKNGKYGIIPVTVEKGEPLFYSYRLGTYMGKDNQLHINSGDFPSLARTGLHSEEELDEKDMITGFPLDVINYTAKPNGYSYSGFIAKDEDIISVLKGDNQLVRELGMIHPEMAKPIFHVWNLILLEIELGNWPNRFYDNISTIFYNNKEINFTVTGSKGWQRSIFFDEIQGRYNIRINRDLSVEEKSYLNKNYNQLSEKEMNVLAHKLTQLDISEMLPYYIMQYGFYEGHVDYRADPIAISFIFGLKSLEELDKIFQNDLYKALTEHYNSK